MAGQQVIVSVLGDVKDVQKKFAETQDAATKTFAGIAGTVAGSKMFDALGGLAETALGEMKDYGDQLDALADQLGSDSAQSFVDGFAANVKGANIQEAMGIGSELAKTITATLGLAGEQAQAVTEQMTQGVLDIAASTDTAAEQVTAAVTAFLQGKDKALAKTMGLDGDYVRGLVEQRMQLDGLTESQARQAVLMQMMGDRAGEAEADTHTLSGAIKEMSDSFSDAGTTLIQALMPMVLDFAEFVTGTVVPAVQGLSQWIKENEAVVKALAVTLAVLLGGFQALSAALTVVSALQAAAGIFKTLEIAQKASAAAQWLVNAAMSANPIGLVVTAIAGLVAGLVWFFSQTDAGREIWEKFTRFLADAWDNMVKALAAAWDFFVKLNVATAEAIVEKWNDLVRWFSGIPDRIKKFFGDAGKWLLDAGRNILAGLWKGFEDDLDTIKNGVSDFAGKFEGWIRDAFGIRSPSTLAYDLFRWIPRGAEKAIEDGTGGPLAAMGRMRDRLVGMLQPGDLGLAVETMRAGGTVNIIHWGGDLIAADDDSEQDLMDEFVAMIHRKTRAGL